MRTFTGRRSCEAVRVSQPLTGNADDRIQRLATAGGEITGADGLQRSMRGQGPSRLDIARQTPVSAIRATCIRGSWSLGPAATQTTTIPPSTRRLATKKSTTVPKTETKTTVVTMRRLAQAAGHGKPGEIVLLLNPKVYGSTGDNWLNGRAYPDREAALVAARKAGATVAS